MASALPLMAAVLLQADLIFEKGKIIIREAR